MSPNSEFGVALLNNPFLCSLNSGVSPSPNISAVRSPVDPVSRSFTVPSGTDRLLVVQSPLDATGVTYAGQVMTRAKNGAESSVKLDTWYLVNPPVGTDNIVWTCGTPWTTGAYSAVVLSGADQAAPIHATLAQGNSFQSSPMTLTVAPPTGGSTLAFFHSS